MIKPYKIPKLALEFIGYLVISVIIATFNYAFLYSISISFVQKLIEKGYYSPYTISDPKLIYWLKLSCILTTLVIFFIFFIFFLGEKVSYILYITKSIQILKSGNLTFRIESVGNNELSKLADTINSFSIALQNHMQNEDKLKREKENLIKSLSHDIRTPLTAIISYSDFIKNKRYNSNEKLENYIEIIQNKAYQIQELTNLLLNTDTEPPNADITPLLEGKLMFEQFISEFVSALEDENFEVEIDRLALVDFKAKFDVQDISRIFDNIYSNIIKYASNLEKIQLEIFIEDNNLVFTQTNVIKDKIPNNIESHGIGLNNINKIVKSYNGEMKYILTQKIYKIEIKIPL
ncbi:HAMP domain-containing sensor histidine kinase [Clostridium botulinum]|uniref:HAMP domain-containing sensor histidine kinase n=1 Tax=Clostridium botulinum TaxID=1491 RepID=UPI0004D3F4A0|nr:HAMP domain-containing sensor histidine kinase [Clostridium botulinum]KEH96438.1 histidine kinase [Clostridium botulinum D str. 16868]